MRRCLVKLEGTAARVSASPTEPRILIVGGGPTGALTAAFLRKLYPAANITIVDKSVRGLGGRMSTLHATGAALGSSVDFGAQYISGLPGQESECLNEELLSAGILRPMAGHVQTQRPPPPGLRNFVSPTGLASLVRHVADSATATVVTGCRLVGLEMGPPSDDGGSGGLQWVAQYAGPSAFALSGGRAAASAAAASAAPQAPPREDGSEPGEEAAVPQKPSLAELLPESDGSDGSTPAGAAASKGGSAVGGSRLAAVQQGSSSVPPAFHAVVLTCPVPQVLALGGDVPALLEGAGVAPALGAVSYSSRYSLALFYSPADWAAVEAALPCAGRFISPLEDDVVRFVAFDSAKRGVRASSSSGGSCGAGGGETCPAVLVHTAVDFGKSYVDTGPALVEPIILEHLRRVAPGLPAHVESHCHRWRYSQVISGYAGPEPFAPAAASPGTPPPSPRRGLLEESHGHSSLAAAGEAAAAGGGEAAADAAAVAAPPMLPVQPPVGAVLVVDDPPLVLAGDAFTGSHWEGCVQSAQRASQLVTQALEKRVVATLA